MTLLHLNVYKNSAIVFLKCSIEKQILPVSFFKNCFKDQDFCHFICLWLKVREFKGKVVELIEKSWINFNVGIENKRVRGN